MRGTTIWLNGHYWGILLILNFFTEFQPNVQLQIVSVGGVRETGFNEVENLHIVPDILMKLFRKETFSEMLDKQVNRKSIFYSLLNEATSEIFKNCSNLVFDRESMTSE